MKNLTSLIKKNKKDSFRNKVLGPPMVYKLPKNFFENVLELELKLKEKFDIKILQELSKLYSTAIEYYESINSPKYIKYQQNLNLLFSDPDIKRHMMGGKKIEKEEKLEEFNKKLEDESKLITNKDIKKIIDNNKDNIDFNKNIEKELDNQKDNFKKRRELKKKKYLLSTSDITDTIDTMVNKIKINDDDLNKSMDINLNNNNKNNENNNNNNILGNLDNDLNNSQISIDLPDFKKNTINYTNKTKFLENIKNNMDVYFNEYFDYFTNKITNNIIKDYDNYYNKLNKNLIENSTNYITQEKEMEFLLAGGDNDDGYNDQINSIIKSLKEDCIKDKEKILKENNDKLKKINDKYLNELSNNNGINLIQEKFKLDLTNILSNVIFK